jgi:hypothetical protein
MSDEELKALYLELKGKQLKIKTKPELQRLCNRARECTEVAGAIFVDLSYRSKATNKMSKRLGDFRKALRKKLGPEGDDGDDEEEGGHGGDEEEDEEEEDAGGGGEDEGEDGEDGEDEEDGEKEPEETTDMHEAPPVQAVGKECQRVNPVGSDDDGPTPVPGPPATAPPPAPPVGLMMDNSTPADQGQGAPSETFSVRQSSSSDSSAKQHGSRWVKWDRGVGSGELPETVQSLGLVAGTYQTVSTKQLETLYTALWPTQQHGIPKFPNFKLSKREAPYVWQGHNVHVRNEDPAVKADKGSKRLMQSDSTASEQPPAKSTKVPCPLSHL